MNIPKLLFQLFLLYLLYKLIFDFVIPVFNATRKMKNQMAEMQERMNATANQQEPIQKKTMGSTQSGDYIDYEEVK